MSDIPAKYFDLRAPGPSPLLNIVYCTYCMSCKGNVVAEQIRSNTSRVSSTHSFIGGVHIGARALHVPNLILFGCIARLSQWRGGNFLVQMISTCLRYARRKGAGVSTLWVPPV